MPPYGLEELFDVVYRAREINLLVYLTYLNSSDRFLKFNSSSLFSQFPKFVVSTSPNNDSGNSESEPSQTTKNKAESSRNAQYMDT